MAGNARIRRILEMTKPEVGKTYTIIQLNQSRYDWKSKHRPSFFKVTRVGRKYAYGHYLIHREEGWKEIHGDNNGYCNYKTKL